MNLKKPKQILLLIWLTIIVSCNVNSEEYLTIDATSYFYSVVIQKDGRLKMQLSPVSIPAMFNYKTRKEQIFLLKPGDKIKLGIDANQTDFHEFEFIQFKNGYVFGSERVVSKTISDRTMKIKFMQYPKIHLENQ